MSTSESIADRVRRLRDAAGMTQAELADESGISRPSMNEIETGITAKPRRSTLVKIAGALGVSTDYLQTGGEVTAKAKPAYPVMTVVQSTEREQELLERIRSLEADKALLIEILRTGGDLSKLGGSFNLDSPEAVETYTHQRMVVAGLVRYQMRLAA